jgi:hypothetical protein
VASNMPGALDARAKLASSAGKEDEERDEKRLSKADRTRADVVNRIAFGALPAELQDIELARVSQEVRNDFTTVSLPAREHCGYTNHTRTNRYEQRFALELKPLN